MGQAALNLQQYASWQAYLSSFSPNDIQEGVFSVVAKEQRRCAQNPASTATHNKQIVNTTIIYFLTVLSIEQRTFVVYLVMFTTVPQRTVACRMIGLVAFMPLSRPRRRGTGTSGGGCEYKKLWNSWLGLLLQLVFVQFLCNKLG